MKKKSFYKLASYAGLCAAMCLVPLQHAFCAPIHSVDVQVVDATGGTSALLLDKMSGSMQVVAQQLFLDKDEALVASEQAEYEHLLTEVGDRVFMGYEIDRAYVNAAPHTQVVLTVRPWSDTIQKPTIELSFSGIDKDTAQQLNQSIPQLKADLERTLTGASVDASDWAGGVLRKLVREEVEKQLPEFRAAVDVITEKNNAIVQVVIFPVGQVVTNVRYEMRSESIPNLLLMQLKYKYLAECDKLRGLPVAYIEHHKEEIQKSLEEKLRTEKDVKNYNLKPVVKLTPGARLNADILMTSEEYKIWLEGYGDIGRDEDNLSGRAHAGKFISKKDEIFAEAEVVLDDVDWKYGPGYTRYWGKSAWTYMRRMPVGDNNYRFEYNFSPKWRLRAEHFSGEDRNEYAIRYRIHEFLSAEYVYGGEEFYLRVIGNL